MSKHNYRLEPNRQLYSRHAMDRLPLQYVRPHYVFAVEVEKPTRAEVRPSEDAGNRSQAESPVRARSTEVFYNTNTKASACRSSSTNAVCAGVRSACSRSRRVHVSGAPPLVRVLLRRALLLQAENVRGMEKGALADDEVSGGKSVAENEADGRGRCRDLEDVIAEDGFAGMEARC
jgi:hypothetical protein